MELETGVRRRLLADDGVTSYVGQRVWKFRLEEPVVDTGRRAVVVRRSGTWATPDPITHQEYPIVDIECWADCSRDNEKQMVKADAEEGAASLIRVIDPLMHGIRGECWGGEWNEGLAVVSSQRFSEPIPVAQTDDTAMFVIRYAMQLVH